MTSISISSSTNSSHSENSSSQLPEENSVVAEENCTPAARFECPICLTWLRNPVLTSCGHRFCRNCLSDWLQRENAGCPVDNMPLKETDLFPDNFTRREISQQKTKCPNLSRGCLTELSPLDVEAHLLVCGFQPAPDPQLPDNERLRCSFVEMGCTEKFETEPALQMHLEQNMQTHLVLLSKAYSKLSQNTSGACSISQQAQLWEAVKYKPSTEEAGGSSSTSDTIISTLYEKIVMLEQKTREQDIIITNLSKQLNGLTVTLNNSHPRHYNGCYLWYVDDFKKKVHEMRQDCHITHYSPGFFTSPNGYKLCVRLNLSPNDRNFVAILIHVMKTNYDQALEWPFSGRLTITLVHPFYPAKNIKETMMTRPDLEAFKRPMQDINPRGFGYTEFAAVEELLAHSYIDNNQLLIKVQAQSL